MSRAWAEMRCIRQLRGYSSRARGWALARRANLSRMELKGSTALVTGANGFVGTYVTQRLLAEGLRVRAWVRRPEARKELERMGAEVILGELTDAATLEAAVVK